MNSIPRMLYEMSDSEIGDIVRAASEVQFWSEVNECWLDPLIPGLLPKQRYRIKPKGTPIKNIPWTLFKPEYKWIAMDQNMAVYVFIEKPYICDFAKQWQYQDGCVRIDNDDFPIELNLDLDNIEWKSSLTERPE